MPAIDWQGRRWVARTPSPSAALVFARYAQAAKDDSATALDELLDLLIGPDQLDDLYEGIVDGSIEGSLVDFVSEIVLASSGRPIRAVVSLSSMLLKSWSIVQGRLIRSGIASPMRDLASLWALLDVVESFVLETKTDEAARQSYLSAMYPSTAAPGAKGWSDEEEAASWEAFTGAL